MGANSPPLIQILNKSTYTIFLHLKLHVLYHGPKASVSFTLRPKKVGDLRESKDLLYKHSNRVSSI